MKLSLDLNRRAVLAGAAPVAGLAAGSLAACGSTRPKGDGPAHTPLFFTETEWLFLNAAVDRLIPHDGHGVGGVEAGVPVFIDRQMDGPYGHGDFFYTQGPFQPDVPASLGYQSRETPRELYRIGIAQTEAACRAAHGKTFIDLTETKQDDVLTALQTGRIAFQGPPAAAFFAQVLANVREGFFADPMYGGNRGFAGWKLIGFPGARADFTDWIDQAGVPYPLGPVGIHGPRA